MSLRRYRIALLWFLVPVPAVRVAVPTQTSKLDIGLPSLNGIEAARRIRKLFPKIKILFVSQESSAVVVQEALALGALGYVVKAHAGAELLAAVEAVLQGRQFVSSGLSGHYFASALDSKTLDHPNEPFPRVTPKASS